MSDIRWICLSDTHFGAENSLLSFVPEGSRTVAPGSAGPVLESLVASLRTLVATNTGTRLPTLVLNGDILELALAQDNVAAMVFDRFVDLAFVSGDPLFDSSIIYIPGNHDHHIWETARERQYAQYVASVGRDRALEPPWHVTRLFKDPGSRPLEAELLTSIVQRRTGSTVTVDVVYPNLAVSSPDGDRTVLFHHGHFIEPLYRLLSLLKGASFPGQPPGAEIWDWESDNFAWIDFFWSTLGRSGDAGEDVGLIHDMLQSPAALARLAGNLGTFVGGLTPRWLAPAARPVARVVLRRLARLTKDRERSRPEVLLSTGGRSGLVDFVSGPLRRQLERERPGASQGSCQLVFGHTHKPFESLQDAPGFASPVTVMNTGGWVVDTERTAVLQGAAVVMVDAACNAVSLRLYNQADRESQYQVRLPDPVGEVTNQLHDQLESRLDLTAAPWTELSAAIAEAVAQRHRLLPRIIEEGLALT